MIAPVTGTRVVIAAVALVLGLAACSGEEPEPDVAPPSPTTPSTTGAAAETPPEMPEAAKGTDAAAAEAFVEFYWEMVDYAQSSGDLDALRQISSDRCIACQAGIDTLDEIFDKSGVITGGISRVVGPETVFVEGESGLDAVVEFDLSSTRQRIDYPGATSDEVYRGGTSSVRARLERAGESWTMLFWGEQ
jgi:Family of unknown function (DUF6318)